MFEKLAKTPVRKSSSPTIELERSIAFLTCLVEEGLRLSYAGLATAARIFGEDSSTQIAAQRGATLVKAIPEALQPFVCRKSGKYAKGVLAQFKTDLPSDLVDRPLILKETVAEAIEIFEKSEG